MNKYKDSTYETVAVVVVVVVVVVVMNSGALSSPHVTA